jgi:hypothetical protein
VSRQGSTRLRRGGGVVESYAGRLTILVVGLFALSLATGVAFASALTYQPGSPASFCTGVAGGSGAGECGELRGIAVDRSNGQIYAADRSNRRIDQFGPSGAFVRAFGTDVVASGQHDNGTTNVEVCEPANSSPVDVCQSGASQGLLSAVKGIAIDEGPVGGHVIYVVAAIPTVAYFNGSPAPIAGNGSNFLGSTSGLTGEIPTGAPESFPNTTSVAVDQSNRLQHYLYVAGGGSATTGKIWKFATSPEGLVANSYVCQITGYAVAMSTSECGGNGIAAHKNGIFDGIDPGGVAQNGGNLAVDDDGNVFLAERPTSTRQGVTEFDKNGNYVTQFRPVVLGHPTLPRPEALGISPTGKLLVADDGPSERNGGAVVQEFDPAAIPSEAPTAVTSAAPLTEFGAGIVGTAAGGSLGVASTDTDVYVADKTNRQIWKFTPAPIPPAVSTDAATLITKFKATLHGEVTPNFGAVTDCHFEYGTSTSYGSNAPCAPSSLGTGGRPVPVSAALAGLDFDTVYHFRLVATSTAGGAVNGEDREFKTTLVNEPEAITASGATLIAQTSATVAGKANPNEVPVTDCHFNYGSTDSYGLTAPCVPSPGSGGSRVDVTASLTDLAPAAAYHFQLEVTNGDGTDKGDDQTFETLPDAPNVTDVADESGQTAAKVKATINPNSGLVSDCHIDYGITASYGSQEPCSPPPGGGASPIDISASLTGLAPSTLYHYRVVATNPGGTTSDIDHSFTTLPPNMPEVVNEGASAGLGNTFTMEGRVDPDGLAITDCHFSYGPTAGYGQAAPCTPSAAELGTGDAAIAVTAATVALEPSTTYHYRLFASNSRGTSQGKDRIFTTGPPPADSCPNADLRAAQGIEVMRLPDCLALEQVSPSKKSNQSARLISRAGASLNADGSRILFNSTATIGDCATVNALGGDIFIGTRLTGNPGWKIDCTTPPVTLAKGFPGRSFTADFSGWIQLTIDPTGRPGYTVRQEGPGGLAVALSPRFEDITDPEVAKEPQIVGVSDDHSRVFVTPARTVGSFLPGDPTVMGPGAEKNLYETHLDPEGNPVLGLVAKDRDAKVWGGNCGAQLGGQGRGQGAVSVGGDRVYFSTRPAQPLAGNCTDSNKKRIMVSEGTPTGPEIKELVGSECSRVSPPCTTVPGDDFYQGASVDQSRVYFTSSRQLTDADLDGSTSSCSAGTAVVGCDLYLYDENRRAGERLVDISAGDSTASTPGVGAAVRNSITAISADGSHVYFVARTILTTDSNPLGAVAQNDADNLYVYSYPEERLEFVGTLAAADGDQLFGGGGNWDNDAYSVPIAGKASNGEETGGDGHVLLFNTKAQLSADDTDAATDIYRYDSDAGTLLRISKALPGGADDGAFGMIVPGIGSFDTGYAEQSRWASEDGSTVVFISQAPLLPGDTNGAEDSYLWRDGQLYHLPGSTRTSVRARRITPILSHDGATIGYHSTRQLTTSDIDSVEDVYVLRPDGGLPLVPSDGSCEGEACQGAPPAPPGETGTITGSLTSPGNVGGRDPESKCLRGKRKVRRGGRTHCIKRVKPHRKRHSKKRTGAKRGGQK